jgi:hypothetical protein
MLQSAVAALESVSGAVPKGGVELAHATAVSSAPSVTAAPSAATPTLEATEFARDAGSVDPAGAADVRPNIVEFHTASISSSSGASQDISDRVQALSGQLQNHSISSMTAEPLSSPSVSGAATPFASGHDATSGQMKAAVGEMKSTYFYMVTASFFSHVGSQCMQVFNTLLKGQ